MRPGLRPERGAPVELYSQTPEQDGVVKVCLHFNKSLLCLTLSSSSQVGKLERGGCDPETNLPHTPTCHIEWKTAPGSWPFSSFFFQAGSS